METERTSNRSDSVNKPLWKRLETCRKTVVVVVVVVVIVMVFRYVARLIPFPPLFNP